MCMLLKLDYAKFGVSNLFFSKVIKEKPLGGSTPLTLVKEGLRCLPTRSLRGPESLMKRNIMFERA